MLLLLALVATTAITATATTDTHTHAARAYPRVYDATGPSPADLKQDPDGETDWYISSMKAVALHSPETIQNIVRVDPENPSVVQVCLQEKHIRQSRREVCRDVEYSTVRPGVGGMDRHNARKPWWPYALNHILHTVEYDEEVMLYSEPDWEKRNKLVAQALGRLKGKYMAAKNIDYWLSSVEEIMSEVSKPERIFVFTTAPMGNEAGDAEPPFWYPDTMYFVTDYRLPSNDTGYDPGSITIGSPMGYETSLTLTPAEFQALPFLDRYVHPTWASVSD